MADRRFEEAINGRNIPLLTLVNVKGFEAALPSEARLAIAASRLAFAFANAGVPKISVILGDAFGSAYIGMNSKALGADIVAGSGNSSCESNKHSSNDCLSPTSKYFIRPFII